jgi:carboxypeptidase Q
MMKKTFITLLLISLITLAVSQEEDKVVIRSIFDNVMTSDVVYENLRYLCDSTPGRLLGSANSYKAVDFMKAYFDEMGADTVFLQEFTTPAWLHKSTEVNMYNNGIETVLQADALGPSPSTPEDGITAKVLMVYGLDELKEMDAETISGKIIFFNRAIDKTKINPFRGYGGAVDQRYHGPALAAEMGAVGVIIRSVGTRTDIYPHTGSTNYRKPLVPCAAISTIDADLLTEALNSNNSVEINLTIDAEKLEEITSYNLIADIKGKEFPDEYIVVGGHIDAWFNTPGAHDDGAGCVQSADVLRIFKELGLKNKRSIRAIMYMDEELYQAGGNAYYEYSKNNNVNNYLALEADAGAFTPRGFNVDASDSIVSIISSYQPILQPYGIEYISKGGSGVDIGPLKELNVPLMGYRTDPQRYMDLHHSGFDSFDKIHIRELQLGSGNMAAIVYLIDKYGL